jgi:hypothetical protein
MGYGIVPLSVKTLGSVSVQESAKQRVSLMATPFTFFRKNQQSLMVVLVILAMLIFTMDSAFTSQENQFVLLGVFVGGALFGIAGIGRGRWVQYGLGGAIFGGLAGWLLPEFVGPQNTQVVATSLGTFDQKRLDELGRRRGIANAFLARATEGAFGDGTARFATQFGFGHASASEDLIFSELMRAEAKELGIAVSDQAVTEFINTVTGERLSKQKYAEARSGLMYDRKPLKDELLYDILREEIAAQIAYSTLRPESSALPATPQKMYAMYRRTEVRQQMNTARISVDDFLDKVAEPTESEIVTAFEAGRQFFPYYDGPDSLGFRQFPKVQLAALELDYGKVEAAVGEITDEEVQKYYDENKATQYRRPVAPEVPQSTGDETKGSDAESSTEESAAAAAAEKAEVPAADTPGEGDKPEPSATEGAKEEKPGVEPETTEPASETPASGSEAKSEKGPDEGTEPVEQPEKVEQPKKTDEPAKEDDGCFAGEVDEEADAASESADEPATAQEATVPANEPVAGAEGVAEAAAASTDAAAGDEPQAGDQPLVIPQATDEASASTGDPPQLSIPVEGEQSAGGDENPFPEIQYEDVPLDDNLREDIREQLLRQKVAEAIDARMIDVMNELKKLENKRRDFRFAYFKDNPDAEPAEVAAEMSKYDDTMIEGMKSIADELGLTYISTPFVTLDELSGEDYPLGSATPPQDNPFAQAGPTVASTVFSGTMDETQFYVSRRSVSTSLDPDSGEQHFAWWVVGYSPSHVPTLDEDGIREQVVKSLKRQKAKELAKERAEALAEQVREGLAKEGEERTGMAATLENATSTGEAEAPTLAVRQTQPFKWMRQSDQFQFDFNQTPQAQLSPIQFGDDPSDTIRYAGNDFMSAVFEDMQEGDVGVVPDQLHQNYYVVQILNRVPSQEVGEESMLTRYLNAGKTGFRQNPVATIARSEIGSDVAVEWEKEVWLKYGVDPDAPPES